MDVITIKDDLFKSTRERILDYIKVCIENNGYSPTIREIAKGVGLSSPATVYEHLKILVQMGVLESEMGTGKKRSLRLTGRRYVDNKWMEYKTMKKNYYIITFTNMKKVFVSAFSEEDATILAYSVMIKNGHSREVSNVEKTDLLNKAYKADYTIYA